jgi:hypothetical protein
MLREVCRIFLNARTLALIASLVAAAAITYIALPASVYASGPHIHGAATLEIAIDDTAVQVNLSSPLVNLLGFEHAPRNEKERQAVRSMASKLHQADTLFIFTPEAQCRLGLARLESSLLPSDLLMPGSPPGKTDSMGVDKQDKPQAVSPARSPTTASPAASTGGHNDEHAELEVTWAFQCAIPGALQGVDVRLFQAFPRLGRLEAAVAGPKGQRSAKLSPSSTRLKW